MLERIIEKKREKMMNLATKYGFHAKETIRCSQELDELINLYQHISTNENETLMEAVH